MSRQSGSALSDQSSNTSPRYFSICFAMRVRKPSHGPPWQSRPPGCRLHYCLRCAEAAHFHSFLTDYATQSRFLIIVPVLILSAPALHERRLQVAQHIETFLVPRDQYPEFHEDWTSSDKLRDSWLAKILIAVLVYATVIWLDRYLSPEGIEFTGWWKGGGGLRFMSPAGTWAAICQLSDPVLPEFSLAVAASALVAILALDHTPEPSARRGSPRRSGRFGISRRRAKGPTTFRLLHGRWTGGCRGQSGLS